MYGELYEGQISSLLLNLVIFGDIWGWRPNEDRRWAVVGNGQHGTDTIVKWDNKM